MRARRTEDGKHAVCGHCGAKLCRRDWVNRVGAPGYYLVWGDGWRLIDGHIERTPSAIDRLMKGNSPGRRDWADEARLALTRALAGNAPVLCDRCGTLNEINRERLDVLGVAPLG